MAGTFWNVKRKYSTGKLGRIVPGVDTPDIVKELVIIFGYHVYATYDEQHIAKNIHDGEYGDTYSGNVIAFGAKTNLIEVGDILGDKYIVVTVDTYRQTTKLYLERLR